MREGWIERKLEELSGDKKAIVSGPFGSNLKVSDYRDSGVPIIRLQNVGKGYFIEKDIKYIEKEKAEELKSHSFVVGDIVLAKLGIPIGKTCIIPESFGNGIILADIVRIRPDRAIVNYNFLEYFLNTSLSVSQLTKNISGATRPRVNLTNVRSILVPIPPLPEQTQIVKTLDFAFAQIDQAKANLEKNLHNAQELFQSKLNEVFSQRGEGWVEHTLETVCKKVFAGGDAPKDNFSNVMTDKYSIPIYANAVKNNGLYGYTDSARVDEPSISIAARGSGTGHTEIRLNPFFPIVRLIVLIPNNELIELRFLKYVVDTLDILRSGSAIPQLTVPMIKQYIIYIPTLLEQKVLIEELDSLSIQVKTLQTNYQQKLNNLEELKKSILQKAFAGEL